MLITAAFFIDDCPVGYVKRIGHTPEWGTSLGGALNLTRDKCAERCSETPHCRSFEHSLTELKCNLNKATDPSSGPYKDYAFCSKTGRI